MRIIWMCVTLALVLSATACTFGQTEMQIDLQPALESEADSSGTTFLEPQPGYYLISSVGENGDVSFYGSLDPVNGYLMLQEDHTGVLQFRGVEQELTWSEESIVWGEKTLPCVYVSYYDSELGREDGMLMVYDLDAGISISFRAAEANEEE